MLAGEPYLADDPEITHDYLAAQRLNHELNLLPPWEEDRRREVLAELLGSYGEETTIRSPFQCEYGANVHVGRGTFVNFGLVILDVAGVHIGDDVQIGPGVQLLTATHPLDPVARRSKWESAAPITIGDNVWLGGGVIVCPGVSIGADSVVAAGAVVSDDVPPGVLAGGVPARVIRTL